MKQNEVPKYSVHRIGVDSRETFLYQLKDRACTLGQVEAGLPNGFTFQKHRRTMDLRAQEFRIQVYVTGSYRDRKRESKLPKAINKAIQSTL